MADRKTAYLTSLKPDAKTCFVNPRIVLIVNPVRKDLCLIDLLLVEKPLPETRDKVLLLEVRDNSLVREAIYIEHLGEIGFKWNASETFEQHCNDLEAFKSEFRHCNKEEHDVAAVEKKTGTGDIEYTSRNRG